MTYKTACTFQQKMWTYNFNTRKNTYLLKKLTLQMQESIDSDTEVSTRPVSWVIFLV